MTTLEVLRTRRTSRELLRALRPRQWPKNLLVFAAPMAAGDLVHLRVLGLAVLAFVSFTLASASTYLLNDVMDATADRLHPDKRLRPVAAGTLSARTAVRVAVVGAVLAAVTAAFTDDELLVVMLTYSALTLAYAHSLSASPAWRSSSSRAGWAAPPGRGVRYRGRPERVVPRRVCRARSRSPPASGWPSSSAWGRSRRPTGPRWGGTPRRRLPGPGRDGC